MVELFTAAEQRGRTSQAYFRSAVGARLRYVAHEETSARGLHRCTVTQRDEATGLVVRTTMSTPHGVSAARIVNEIENSGEEPVTLTAVSSATFGFARSEEDLDAYSLAVAESEWLAENRWSEGPLRSRLPWLHLDLHGQDGRGHFGYGSRGAWSTGEHLPMGILVHSDTAAAVAWQIESGGAWHCDLTQTRTGGVVSLLGPTDLDHQFAHTLDPGERFTTVPVTIVSSPSGRDGAVAELTRVRRAFREPEAAGGGLPIVYNDFMNTLMGQPSTEALEPLIDAAAQTGAEYFCIDAGWFADPAVGDWWSTVGEWREAPQRFGNGLRGLVQRIHDKGMRSGIWIEPEVVGVGSQVARELPDEAFFNRLGRRVQEHERFHLDFRHQAARKHLDETVDHLVTDYGFSYLKLDYNINPGAGTEWRAAAPGDGLLAHARAFREWLLDIQRRHPGLIIENCSSGAMRADFALTSATHLQSTSDQQDFRLYPPIAAAAPAAILPEQCGDWAYPSAAMTDEETAFTLVTGLSGRLYLSGFLHELRAGQAALVREAVTVHRKLRVGLPQSLPFWPLGFPGWDDPIVCLGLDLEDARLLFVWDRSAGRSTIEIPGLGGEAVQVFPESLDPWTVTSSEAKLVLRSLEGATARVFRIS